MDECNQVRCEVRALEGERSRLSEEKRRLEEQLEEQLRPLRREMEQVQRNLLTKRKRIVEVENAKRLDKLPKEVWERIFDELNENDLFPLALSCKYFRQKQVELVARSEQSPRWGGVPPLALRTDLKLKVYGKREPASAGYVQFLSKDRELTPADRRGSGGGIKIRWLAAFHGYLPLLQELPKSKTKEEIELLWITRSAGESSSSQSHLLLYFDF